MNQLKIPSDWSRISLGVYLEFKKIQQLELGLSEYTLELVSLFNDISPDDPIFEEVDFDDLLQIHSNTHLLDNDPLPRLSNWNEYQLKPLTKMTLGEFIDIENLVSNEDFIVILCSILMRRNKTDEWGNIVWEPYEYNPLDRVDYFMDLPVNIAFGIFKEWESFRINFMNNYDNLFNPPIDNGGDEVEEELTGRELLEAKKEMLVEEAKKKWSWESLVWSLCNEDITKMTEVFNTPVILAFNILSMKWSTTQTN